MLANYEVEPDQEFEVELPKGEKLRFRSLRDYDELVVLKDSAAKLFESIKKRVAHPEMLKVAPTQPETIAQVVLLAALSLDDDLSNQLAWMKLCKRAPNVVILIHGLVEAKVQAHLESREHERVETE